jgi:preprotein translocase subunit YajC
MNLLSILLQAAAPAKGFDIMSMLPLLLIIVVFYFFMIRPQLKKSKDQKKYRQELKKGDKIITIGGVHGKIVELNEKTFIIEVEGGNRLKIERAAVSMEFSASLEQNT